MKRLVTLAVGALLAVSLFVGLPVKGSIVHPQSAKACSESGWYYAKVGGLQYTSYTNYATGQTAYIYFRSFLVASQDNCWVYGETDVWTSDGYAFPNGSAKARMGWQGAGQWGSTCTYTYSVTQEICSTNLGYTSGDLSTAWADNYYGGYTTVTGPFGGSYSGYSTT